MRAPALLRSMLFVPGDQARMMEKARGLATDAIILDLEDGVAAKDKVQARTLIRAAVAGGFPPEVSVWLRPNALATGSVRGRPAGLPAPGHRRDRPAEEPRPS